MSESWLSAYQLAHEIAQIFYVFMRLNLTVALYNATNISVVNNKYLKGLVLT